MASKKKRRDEDLAQEEVLTAVVLADSFNVRFAPITHRKPRTLLPLVNVPLLDYTLEFLCSAGIERVYLFCCAHAEQIKEHVRKSKWSTRCSPCEVIPIVSEDCLSLGDALREIDAKALIDTDFVLVNGDLVSNLPLKDLIEEHKERVQKVKSSVMTMVFMHAAPHHRTRCREEEVLVAVDRPTQRVLHYRKVGTDHKFELPAELFQEFSDIQLRYDLLDCHISICSPLVPQLFTDNFDYQTSDDFVRGILVSEEILGNTIHMKVVEEGYAARVSNLQMYDAVSKDIISRWSFPLVPDNDISNNNNMNKYSYGRHNIYLNKDITLARGCVLQEDVVIGPGTSIGSGSTLAHSVVGRNCKIGENVKLENAYIWDGVTIENGVSVTTAVIADNAVLKKDVTVEPGCVFSYDVIVGPSVKIPSGTILSSAPVEDDGFSDEEEETVKGLNPVLVGSQGVAYLYQPDAEDSDNEDIIQDMWGLTIQSEEDDASSVGSMGSDELSPPSSPPADDMKLFYGEVLDTLERVFTENIGTDNTILEINSLKHAYNITINELNGLVTKAIIAYPQRNNKDMDPPKLMSALKPVLAKLLPVLRNYMKNTECQLECLAALEDYSIHHPSTGAILMKVMQVLYNADVLSEEAILHWYENVPTDHADQHQKIRKKVETFIKWLEEAEEESD
ncbi:translation initiation factor eIF-2B subunit epsilon-like [Lingula anatina]|uniref:Translation initiation factor eIF2B subunit epsilon n=1 Tax=Lingula anatina TaxID=7574 RepID=A0A1S3K8P5_LINAN|nr:translation initiation factor eIF-2B subunit epsilon-like [Lingula anatina]|eukprot:XP_013418621.1 translation initiation factor eIF-2B subunit epsilon-like [Lingula anatina]